MRTVATLFFACLCLAGTASAENYLTLEEIVGLKRVTSAAMSPAGDRIAYLKSVPRELYVDANGPAWV